MKRLHLRLILVLLLGFVFCLPQGHVDIKKMKRFDATQKYVSQLNRQFLEFKDLGGPPMKGDPEAPFHTEPITLASEGTVLEHFVQLLGDDPTAVFSIVKARSGVPIFVFYDVKK